MKTVDFSETIAASDLKVSRSRHLIEYMKVCEYLRSMSFLDLGLRSCTYKNSYRIFSEILIRRDICMLSVRVSHLSAVLTKSYK